jgi:ectoine hydroxylase-related dioxygenase (phytanoyl-CoA dioxygenase family)
MVHLVSSLRTSLERDGFAVVRNVLPREELEAFAKAFDRLVDQARHLDGTTDLEGSRFVVDANPFHLHRVVWCGGAEPSLLPYGGDARFLRLASEALSSNTLVQLLQQAHFKLPGDGVTFGWHQDASNRRYGTDLWTDVDGHGSFVQMTMAVDPMGPGNGGLRMLPGTHRLGFIADQTNGSIPVQFIDEAKAIDVELGPGDVALFGAFVIHGSGPNTSPGPRRLFIQGYALPNANRREYPGCGRGVERTFTRGSAPKGTSRP